MLAALASFLVLAPALLFQQPALDPPAEAKSFVRAVVAWIDEEPESSIEAVRAAFDDTLRGMLDAAAVEGVLKGLRDAGAVQVTPVARTALDASHVTWTFALEQEHSLWTTDVTLDPAGRVDGWYVRPAPRRVARAELEQRLAAWKGDWGLALALVDGAGQELGRVERASGGRELFPLGSTFKLYVLAELARQASAGRIDLDAEIAIEEAKKSLPSGEMQNLADGTRVAIRRMAEQMIKISDNTATDHLLALVGRENVESHLAEYLNSAPARNQPFLSTFDLFLIKSAGRKDWQAAFGKDADSLKRVVELWTGAEPEQRRAWLAELRAHVADEEPKELRARIGFAYGTATLLAPTHVDIEWLARPRDIVELVLLAQRGKLVDAATSRTFLDFYRAGNSIYGWPGVVDHGFKGGSETSVLVLSTRVVLEDGRTVVACIARCGFPALDTAVQNDTLSLFIDLIRNLFEGDPPKPAADAAK